MPYSAPIDRAHPTAFLFLVDQSGSMSDMMNDTQSKATIACDVLNRTLMDLVIRSTKSDGVRDYFHIGMIGYSGHGVSSGFIPTLGNNSILHPVSAIESNPLRIEERTQRVSDGCGGLVEQTVRFPVWFEPSCVGGTPMCEALFMAADTLAAWCDAHPDSYPPTVLHITDGEANDGSPEPYAEKVKQIGTKDGQVLLFNLHISTSSPNPVRFPATNQELSDPFAKMLFNMSSPFSDRMRMYAAHQGLKLNTGARGFAFNAGLEELVDLFDIGTRAMQLR